MDLFLFDRWRNHARNISNTNPSLIDRKEEGRGFTRGHLRFYCRIARNLYVFERRERNVLRLSQPDTSGYIPRPNPLLPICQPGLKARKIIDSIRGNKDVPSGEKTKSSRLKRSARLYDVSETFARKTVFTVNCASTYIYIESTNLCTAWLSTRCV